MKFLLHLSLRSVCQKAPLGAFFFSGLLVSVQAQGNGELALSDSDRMALIEKIEKIEKASSDRVTGLYLTAINSYRGAVRSDAETMKLYLNCYEKINFEEKNLKSSDFRDWKKKNEEKLGSGSFRMALRLQLAWLLLSIETASRDGDVTEMGPKAVAHLNTIFENAKFLEGNQKVLKESALNSVFSKSYELNINIEGWPKSGLDIDGIYEKLIMPPLRNTGDTTGLRTAWMSKIKHLGQSVSLWSKRTGTSIGMKDSLISPDVKSFQQSTRPQLIWDMEKDCFETGDERGASLNMIKHLETYVSHKNAPKWIEEFQAYVAIPEVEELPNPAE